MQLLITAKLFDASATLKLKTYLNLIVSYVQVPATNGMAVPVDSSHVLHGTPTNSRGYPALKMFVPESQPKLNLNLIESLTLMLFTAGATVMLLSPKPRNVGRKQPLVLVLAPLPR
jgi:hypothetical protein